MSSTSNVNLHLLEIEQIMNNQTVGDTFSQAQLNAMVQLSVCFNSLNNNNPTSPCDLEMLAAAINNVMTELFPSPPNPTTASKATMQLYDDLTTVDTTAGTSLAQAAASSNPAAELGKMSVDIGYLYNDCINTSTNTCWFVNGRDQSGVPAYTPDADSNMQVIVGQFMSQISGIEGTLYNTSQGTLSPTNDPYLYYSGMDSLAGFLSAIEGESSTDNTNGYSNALNALFTQSMTLPGSSTPTTLGALITAYQTATPTNKASAALALQQALYGVPPAPGNGQGLSGTIYEYMQQFQNFATSSSGPE